MSILINIILFIFILGFIVFIHEFGHFTFAKITGVYVYEFAIGMGPKIFSKKKGETEYCIRAIPIGGFCQLAGEDVSDDELKKIPKDRRLQNKSCFERFLIMFFGAGNNFISAILILFFIALVFGGTSLDPIISSVEKDSPAMLVGLQKGDVITSINGHSVSTSDDISLYLAIADPTAKASIQVLKNNQYEKIYSVKPKKVKENGHTVYRYGIGIQQLEKRVLFLNKWQLL